MLRRTRCPQDSRELPEEFDESKDDDQKAASLVDEVKSVYQDQSSVPQSIVTSNDTDDDSLPNYNNVNSHSADSPDGFFSYHAPIHPDKDALCVRC